MMDDSLDRLHRYYDGSANRWLLYDGHSLIAETNSSGTAIARRYVHGPGVDEPLVWYEVSGGTSVRSWLHADERGSVIAISNDSGAVTNINAYDEYGIPASSNAGRFQYTGQQWLAELGMQYSRARIYSPTLGRFLQTDPIGYGDGMNMYAYVGGDPVNETDPSGLSGGGGLCTGTRICPSGQNGGVSPAHSGYSLFVGGHFERFRPNTPADGGPDNSIVVGSSFRWVPGFHFDLSGLRWGLGLTARGAAEMLDRIAEDYLKPPEGRSEGESYGQCVNRISGPGAAALGIVGAASIGAGGAWLGYPRVGLGGGGGGTSLISSAARGSLGSSSIGRQILGTGNLGGVAGRGLSRISVAGGAGAVGLAAGTLAGALQRCRQTMCRNSNVKSSQS